MSQEAIIGILSGILISLAGAIFYYGYRQGSTNTSIEGIREDIKKLTNTLGEIFQLHRDLNDKISDNKDETNNKIFAVSQEIGSLNNEISNIHQHGCDRRNDCSLFNCQERSG